MNTAHGLYLCVLNYAYLDYNIALKAYEYSQISTNESCTCMNKAKVPPLSGTNMQLENEFHAYFHVQP